MSKLLIGLFVFIAANYAVAQSFDPTRPLSGYIASGQPEKKVGKLILTAIIHGKQQHTVVINGQTLRVNDTIGEYQLIAVNDRSVLLRSPQESLKLSIFSNVVANTK